MPLVSVIIPAYNAERTIQVAVRSALAQSMADLEVIVCDDASSDGTAEAVHALTDPRVRLIRNDENLGPGRSRDRAIDAAHGTWIAWLDADDIWLSQRLEALLRTVGASANTMVFDNIMICHDTSEGIRPWRTMRRKGDLGTLAAPVVDVPASVWARSRHLLAKPVFPVSALRATGVRHSDLQFGEDTEFLLRLVAKGMRLRYLPEALYLYRVTAGSMTSNPDKARLMRDMLKNVLPLFQGDARMLEALQHKIDYRTFTMALKGGDLHAALRLAWRNPAFVHELVSRGLAESNYGFNRILRGGLRLERS